MSTHTEARGLEHRLAEVRRSAEDAFEALGAGDDSRDSRAFVFPWWKGPLTSVADLLILEGELEVMASLMNAVQKTAGTIQAIAERQA